MKRIIIGLIFAAGCMLPGCSGRTVPADTSTDAAVTSATSTSSTTSTVTTTAVSTTTVTTTTVPKDPPDSVKLQPLENVEVYSHVSYKELFPDTNVKLKDEGKEADTSDLGEKTIKVAFEYEGGSYEKEVKYNVVDTTPPLVINSGWEPYAKQGEPFDLGKIVGFADNYDKAPVLTYEGDVNTDEVGHYPVKAIVTDSSGNRTDWDLEVLVLSEIPKPADNNARVDFADFKAANSYENSRFGIDVSAWQTNVDYNAVKEAGVEFVIMRMGYYYSEVKLDDYYHRNMEEATAAGLDVGVYFYTTDNTEEKVREHARWIVETLDGRKPYFPIAFDWEEWSNFQKYGMSLHDLNNIFEAFCDELEKAGYKGMLYSSKNFLDNVWENRRNRPVWLAHYVDETNYSGDYAIWQASAYGRLAGIDGDVDMNIQFMDEPLDK
ncbi:MAG TPA: GH25 family lysozyme [Ruminococcus sp.]|nr:GH25 family lysozyme [Ruminococcus sp.]